MRPRSVSSFKHFPSYLPTADKLQPRAPIFEDTYGPDEILEAAGTVFGGATERVGEAVEKGFAYHGRPNARIAGEELMAQRSNLPLQ